MRASNQFTDCSKQLTDAQAAAQVPYVHQVLNKILQKWRCRVFGQDLMADLIERKKTDPNLTLKKADPSPTYLLRNKIQYLLFSTYKSI